MERVLIVDDDVELCDLVTEYLVPDGFEIVAVHNGNSGVVSALEQQYSLIVLDVMLPGLNGLDVLRRIRAADGAVGSTPILMLTARGDDVDRIVGLELGADDYLSKPFNPREMVARIRAILRRTRTEAKTPAPGHEVLQVGDATLDSGARILHCRDKYIELTALEFDLLAMLLREAGHVVTRENIAKHVFDRKFLPYDRSIDMHISNLRKKLGPHADGRERLKTVRGVGYVYTTAAKD